MEQVIDADDLAGALGEAQQQPHGPHIYPSGFSISRNLAGHRIDAPVADAKHCRGWAFHAVSVITRWLSIEKRPSPIVPIPWRSAGQRHFRSIQSVSGQVQDFPGGAWVSYGCIADHEQVRSERDGWQEWRRRDLEETASSF
jgi:hypothetical protein